MILVGIVILLIVLLILPLLIPVPPLNGTVPPEDLADPDSHFADVSLGDASLRVHYKIAGQGEQAFVLLHGFASSVYSWREVMQPLAAEGTVVAFDRPAFGLTQRLLPDQWRGQNPYAADSQVDLTVGLMDNLGIEKAILVGNSAGGTVAMQTALRYPERVQALILVSPAVYAGGGPPGFVTPLLQLPQVDHLAPLLVRRFASAGETLGRTAWHDPSKLTPEVWEGYKTPLRADNWDIALWEFMRAGRAGDLAQRLSELTVPTLIITGDDDRVVPTAQSVRLAGEMPNAQLVVVPQCGHVTHEECPAAFMQAVDDFLARQ